MKRRNFLTGMSASAVGAMAMAMEHPLRPRFTMANAQTTNGKTVVVVFQRGGCDGLNAVVPYGDDEYYNLRPTIAVQRPSANPLSAIDLDGFFGLHPSLSPLKNIYDAGDLAVFPAAHYPDASRSHFRSQDWIEMAEPGAPTEGSGWLSKHLQSSNPPAAMRAAGVGGSLPKSLQGDVPVSVFNSLSGFALSLPDAEEQLLLQSLQSVYGQSPTPATAYRDLVHDTGRVVINDLGVINGLDLDALGAENGAQYPNTGFGRQMNDAARLIKAGIGLEVAALGIGGWDTHSDQGAGEPDGRQARRFDDFASSIAAMRTDLGSRMDDVIILTMTEFGRTSKENGSFGTDHGNAAAWFMLGNSVNGGIYGQWPGLDLASLYRERYLMQSVDFRNIMGDLLLSHLGAPDLSNLLPNHVFETTGSLASV